MHEPQPDGSPQPAQVMLRLRLWLAELRRSTFAFPLAVAVALGLLLISEVSYRDSMQSVEQLRVKNVGRVATYRLLDAIVEAEGAQRGFLLTGNPEYLRPYQDAAGRLELQIHVLEEHYRSNAVQQSNLVELLNTLAAKLSELQTTIDVFVQGREAAARDLVAAGIGREQMEAIRVAADKLILTETASIDAERSEIRRTLGLNRIGVGAVTALTLLAFFMYLQQSAALDAERRQQQRALQAERDSLDAQVRARTAELTDLAQHLQTAREDERSRLARELHDELGALLTAAKLDLARLKSRLRDVSPEAAERITHLNDALNSGIALKRRIIEDLRPSTLNNLGLKASLDILAREFAERSGLAVQAEIGAVKLSASCELTAYRMVQEALTNVAKYAQAAQVNVLLQARPAGALLRVQDDGVGFEPARQRSSAHGLLGMRYRVEAEGGRLQIVSAPGEGTCIEAVLPSPAAAQ
jgi:signal transduction histidine kinase